MQFDLLSWGIGIPTGIGVNWLSIWLYQRYQRKKQAKGEYFTASYSNGGIDFEGRVQSRISAEEIMKGVLESLKHKPMTEGQPTSTTTPPDGNAN
ncbi:MAG: hypothetical protein PVJ61_00255 [Dehalococcoidia bacterium]